MNIIKNKDLNNDGCEEKNNDLDDTDKEKRKNRFILPSKQFQSRRSLIVALVEDNIHLKSLYDFVAGLTFVIMFSLNVNEYHKHGRMSPALHLIYKAFGKLHMVFVIWLGNNIFTFICYYAFIVWSKMRKTGFNINILDQFCLMLLIIYYGFSFIMITFLIFKLNIPFASSIVLTLESVRFLMKVHAFIRSNVPKVLNKSKKKNVNLPTFLQYAVFLYIPTTVYKDEYPRSNKIRWNFVLHRFIEIMWCIACMAHLFIYKVTPIFRDICFKPITILGFFVLCLECGVPSLFITFLFIFSITHSSQNGVGEIMKFDDRTFYLDWWNLKDGQQFFQKWNWVVGDFLKYYVYKDLYEKVNPGNRVLAKFLTFLISAIVHEWYFFTATGFFCPITTVLMFFGAFLLDFQIYNINFNIISYKLMFLGSGFMGTLFCVEAFARQNLPFKNDEMFVFWNNCFV